MSLFPVLRSLSSQPLIFIMDRLHSPFQLLSSYGWYTLFPFVYSIQCTRCWTLFFRSIFHTFVVGNHICFHYWIELGTDHINKHFTLSALFMVSFFASWKLICRPFNIWDGPRTIHSVFFLNLYNSAWFHVSIFV